MNTITLHYDIKELWKTQKALSKRNSALNFKDGIYFKNGRNIYYFAKGTIIPKLLITLDSTIYQQSIFQAMPIFCFFSVIQYSTYRDTNANFLNMQIEPLYADIQQDSPYILQVANILRNDSNMRKEMQKQGIEIESINSIEKTIELMGLHTRHEQKEYINSLTKDLRESTTYSITQVNAYNANTALQQEQVSHNSDSIMNDREELTQQRQKNTTLQSKQIRKHKKKHKAKHKTYVFKTRKGKRVRASFHFYKHKESKAKQWFFRESHTNSILSQEEIQNLTNLTIKQESCMQSTTQKNQERDTYAFINTILQESNTTFEDLFSMDSYIQEQLALRKSA